MTETSRRSACWPGAGTDSVAADAGVTAGASVKGVPHSPQNLSPAVFAEPQLGQVTASRVPHSPQNLRPGSLAALQLGQIT
jgi:hypothetical protein